MVGAMSKPLTLLICDDHQLLTDALQAIVGSDPGLALVGSPVGNAEDAVALAGTHQPDVALMDIELDGPVDGIEATRRIKAVSPATKVIVVSGHRRRTVMVEAVEAGASGFVDKNTAVEDLLSLVRAAAAGEVLVDAAALAELLPLLAAERQADQEAERRIARLTRREREILNLMAEGQRVDDISQRLGISKLTARTHAQNILSKLKVHSQLEAVAMAARSEALTGHQPTAHTATP
jgi:DNA-binding NarL/FixJ family response regulator